MLVKRIAKLFSILTDSGGAREFLMEGDVINIYTLLWIVGIKPKTKYGGLKA